MKSVKRESTSKAVRAQIRKELSWKTKDCRKQSVRRGRSGSSRSAKHTIFVEAGNLVATILKLGNESAANQYSFDIRRKGELNFPCTGALTPSDLAHFVSLTRIMSQVILDDGCLSEKERAVLKDLRIHLDAVCRSRNERNIPQ